MTTSKSWLKTVCMFACLQSAAVPCIDVHVPCLSREGVTLCLNVYCKLFCRLQRSMMCCANRRGGWQDVTAAPLSNGTELI